VPEYDATCHCAQWRTEGKARELADQKLGTIEAIRKAFHERQGIKSLNTQLENALRSDEPEETKVERTESLQRTIQSLWEAEIAPRAKFLKEAEAADPDRTKPDPTCHQCHGTGTYKSTYNPNSKWDWYSEDGGRWAESYDQSGGNIRSLKEHEKAGDLYRVLTPDGIWHEYAKAGWWGITYDENADWEAEKAKILEQYGDHMAVAVDCHI